MDRSSAVDQEKGGAPRVSLSGLSTAASKKSRIPCPSSASPVPATTAPAKSSALAKSQGPPNRPIKTHVPSACANCKKAHLACDISRPCKRCVAMGKTATCVDVQHKKRGRPKLKHAKPPSDNSSVSGMVMASTIIIPPSKLVPVASRPQASIKQHLNQFSVVSSRDRMDSSYSQAHHPHYGEGGVCPDLHKSYAAGSSYYLSAPPISHYPSGDYNNYRTLGTSGTVSSVAPTGSGPSHSTTYPPSVGSSVHHLPSSSRQTHASYPPSVPQGYEQDGYQNDSLRQSSPPRHFPHSPSRHTLHVHQQMPTVTPRPTSPSYSLRTSGTHHVANDPPSRFSTSGTSSSGFLKVSPMVSPLTRHHPYSRSMPSQDPPAFLTSDRNHRYHPPIDLESRRFSAGQVVTPRNESCRPALSSDVGVRDQPQDISSFAKTPDKLPDNHSPKEVLLVLSMDSVCLRVTSNSTDVLGIAPQDLLQRSFTDFLYSNDSNQFLRLRQTLLDQLVLSAPSDASQCNTGFATGSAGKKSSSLASGTSPGKDGYPSPTNKADRLPLGHAAVQSALGHSSYSNSVQPFLAQTGHVTAPLIPTPTSVNDAEDTSRINDNADTSRAISSVSGGYFSLLTPSAAKTGLASMTFPGNAASLQSLEFYQVPIASLMVMAKRTSSTQGQLHFRRTTDGAYNLLNVKIHLGGGLGAECNKSDTYHRLYIMCYIAPFELDSLLELRPNRTPYHLADSLTRYPLTHSLSRLRLPAVWLKSNHDSHSAPSSQRLAPLTSHSGSPQHLSLASVNIKLPGLRHLDLPDPDRELATPPRPGTLFSGYKDAVSGQESGQPRGPGEFSMACTSSWTGHKRISAPIRPTGVTLDVPIDERHGGRASPSISSSRSSQLSAFRFKEDNLTAGKSEPPPLPVFEPLAPGKSTTGSSLTHTPTATSISFLLGLSDSPTEGSTASPDEHT
ncbi:hypothetical protein IWQ62_000819 [Dispira parvispora]|uniref:Zn(2)-C6 fungal-type domain-containing protein n=1 Tax=Dispira parvispora TaxID=1520584 RepID=A0A9W8AXJ3_9FUNG|nr:hypothetical protein IWQ62_000819 [Dispira parvispora]